MKGGLKTEDLPNNLPLKYLGGDVSLDLVNTVDWTSHGLANERLTSYDRLTRWAEGAGLLGNTHGQRLRATARKQAQHSREVLRRAQELRAVLRQIYQSVAGGAGRGPVWEEFNHEMALALRQLRIAPPPRNQSKGRRAAWTWNAPAGRLDSFLWPIVWSAAKLLTSEEAVRIRTCGGPDCGWMYVDRSRNGLRRWCAMQTCGTMEKTRRRRERRLSRAHHCTM
jgi:predicted RNA-binding Zn ribbon-like protein